MVGRSVRKVLAEDEWSGRRGMVGGKRTEMESFRGMGHASGNDGGRMFKFDIYARV